jgi:hypothetical protein
MEANRLAFPEMIVRVDNSNRQAKTTSYRATASNRKRWRKPPGSFRNDGVGGSNPSCGTSENNHLAPQPQTSKPPCPCGVRKANGTEHHGTLGAAAGCIIGHHEANSPQRQGARRSPHLGDQRLGPTGGSPRPLNISRNATLFSASWRPAITVLVKSVLDHWPCRL